MEYFKDKDGKPVGLNELQVNQGVANRLNLTSISEDEAYELMLNIEDELTDAEVAAKAQAYLNSTDYIYLSQKEKGLSDEEVAEKYADIITKRIEQRAIVSAYEDSL